jgi:hypothetical protein
MLLNQDMSRREASEKGAAQGVSENGRSSVIYGSPRIVFVTLSVVRIVRGCDAETVLNCIGDATNPQCLRWVFNVAVNANNPKRRELRFWKQEVWGDVSKWTDPKIVIAEILGARQSFPRGEIEVQWLLGHNTISRLASTGELKEVNRELPRAGLAAFLERRLQ